MNAMRNMLAEFTRDNGQSESGGVVGSAAVGESPGGAISTVVRLLL